MRIIGLTGGIGSGKSTVSKMFMELGIPVYDSDSEAKNLMEHSANLKAAIKQLLGKDAYKEGKLNRAYIAAKVFNDTDLLKRLNGIVHPAVREHFMEWAKKQSTPYVVQETALIFENDSQDQYDHTILVTAPKDLRVQRVIDRDGVDRKAVLERMKNQMDDAEKKAMANFCIENVDLETTRKTVKELHTKLMAMPTKF